MGVESRGGAREHRVGARDTVPGCTSAAHLCRRPAHLSLTALSVPHPNEGGAADAAVSSSPLSPQIAAPDASAKAGFIVHFPTCFTF